MLGSLRHRDESDVIYKEKIKSVFRTGRIIDKADQTALLKERLKKNCRLSITIRTW